MSEFKTEHRISDIMRNLKFSAEEARKVYDAFDKLLVLKKRMPDSYIAKNRLSFFLDCSAERKYVEKMMWINDFMQAKGYPEPIFRKVNDFDTSMDDYDYYNAYKTPTEYRLDTENREAVSRK